MRAKRQILSLLLVLLLVWQGFSFANAETGSTQGTGGGGTEVSTASSNNIPGGGTTSGSNISGTGTESEGKEITGAIHDPELLINGTTPLENAGSLASYQNLQFKAKIKVQGLKIKKGDYIIIQLPKQLKSTDTSFKIKGTGEVILANGTYKETDKQIRITFTEDVESYSGGEGEVYFNTRIDQQEVASETNASFSMKINGQAVISYSNINYQVVTKETPKSFYKDRDMKLYSVVDEDGNTHYLIHYIVTLDMRNIQKNSGATSYANVVFTDTLQDNALTYFDVKNDFTKLKLMNQSDIDNYAPLLRKGFWRSGASTNGVWTSAPDDSDANRGDSWSLRNNRQNPSEKAPAVVDAKPKYSGDGRSFTYSLGELAPDDGYELSYYVEINKAFKNGDIFNNSASLTGDGITVKPVKRDFVVSEAGGYFTGNNFKIQIKKVGDDDKALQGAKFTLVNPNTNYTEKNIVTDENGIAKLDNVLKAEYVLTEVEAPVGYQLDPTPYTISKEDFENSIADDATVKVEMHNKKNNVPPVNPGNGGGNGGGNPPKPSPNPSTPNKPDDPSGNGGRPGEVLNANRPSISSSESNPEGSVLGAGRNKAPEDKGGVLGAGRGQTKTGDSANMPVYFALFALTGLGFCIVVLNNGRKEKKQ